MLEFLLPSAAAAVVAVVVAAVAAGFFYCMFLPSSDAAADLDVNDVLRRASCSAASGSLSVRCDAST